MGETELKPCPFCGGKAEMIYWKMQGREFMQEGRVSCKNDCNTIYGKPWSDIRTDKRHETSNEDRAITAWNTRTPNKEDEELKSILEAAIRVFLFDLSKMREFGPEYNQAVVDVGDRVHALLARLYPEDSSND